ncbi:MAG: M20 family peptidase [Spirochaetes bacterium]|nr:M20 family peptidase [Spirochaetota bacterium]
MVKNILKIIGILILVFLIILVVKALTISSKQVDVKEAIPYKIDSMIAAQHLSEAIQIQTISNQDKSKTDFKTFEQFHKFLAKTYPGVHKKLKKEVVAGYSLLYTWKGSDPSLKPMLLMAHQDVVPVEELTKDQWKYPGFSGTVADGYVWGRGALDIKNQLIAIMEAVEFLVARGFAPKRTIYLAFGHDEEVGGEGAKAIAKLLNNRNVTLEYVIDEGGAIMEGMLPGIESPIALVGIAEKGYLTVKLTVKGEGGHSSMPPHHTALGVLAKALVNVENNPFPKNFDSPARQMFEYVAPHMKFPLRILFANMWCFKPLLKWQFEKSESTNAMIRTTAAVTMAGASEKENVLPTQAWAMINCRILPGETMDTTIGYLKKVIDNDAVVIEAMPWSNNPSPVSDIHQGSFTSIATIARQINPDVIVAPYLVLGATDSRHFNALTNQIYRFSPVKMNAEDLKRIHGINERISISDLGKSVKFVISLIEKTHM